MSLRIAKIAEIYELALRTPENIMESALHATPVGNGHHTDYFLWLRSTPDTTIYPTGPIPLDSFFK